MVDAVGVESVVRVAVVDSVSDTAAEAVVCVLEDEDDKVSCDVVLLSDGVDGAKVDVCM